MRTFFAFALLAVAAGSQAVTLLDQGPNLYSTWGSRGDSANSSRVVDSVLFSGGASVDSIGRYGASLASLGLPDLAGNYRVTVWDDVATDPSSQLGMAGITSGPGSVVYDATILSTTPTTTGYKTKDSYHYDVVRVGITLTSPIVFAPGSRYWISVSPDVPNGDPGSGAVTTSGGGDSRSILLASDQVTFVPAGGQTGDLAIQLYGTGIPTSPDDYMPHPVPEPASMAALAMGGLVLLRRRQRG